MEPEEEVKEKPDLSETFSTSDTSTRWRSSSKETEDKALGIVGEAFPVEIRATNAQIEQFYEEGYLLYNSGKYWEALERFQRLNMLNPKNVKYLFATAACFHMLKKYDKAVRYYNLATAFDQHNPLPPYHITDCFLKQNQKLAAMVFLEMAVERSKGKERYRTVCERSTLLFEKLAKELKDKKGGNSKENLPPLKRTKQKGKFT